MLLEEKFDPEKQLEIIELFKELFSDLKLAEPEVMEILDSISSKKKVPSKKHRK